MGKTINLQEEIQKKLFNKIVSGIGAENNAAHDAANEYCQLMCKDPSTAIKRLPEFMERVRDLNPERYFVEAVAGGPNHNWTGPMLDIVGTVYSALDRDTRKEGLLQCMNFLNHLRSDYSQNHVELINDPWLVSDIYINQPLYWCGYEEYTDLLQKNISWNDFAKNTQHVKSEFWLSLAISRPKYSSLEIRHNYYKQFPDLMDRTKDGIAAIINFGAEYYYKKENISMQESIDKELSGYDTLLHNDILKKIDEKKWIRLDE